MEQTKNVHDAPFACIFQGVVGLPGPAGPIGHPGPPVRSCKHALM